MEQMTEARQIDTRVEAVNERLKPSSIAGRVESADKLGRALAHRLECGIGATVDLLDIPIGEGGGHKCRDLAVVRAAIFVGNAEGVGYEKGRLVIATIQLIQKLLELCLGAHGHGDDSLLVVQLLRLKADGIRAVNRRSLDGPV